MKQESDFVIRETSSRRYGWKRLSICIVILIWGAMQVTAFHYQPDPNRMHPLIIKSGNTIESRFRPPRGFQRIKIRDNSFASHLRRLPLKRHGSNVHYYNGKIKANRGIYDAVIDLKIGRRDLHQCADAVMRLRADYLWKAKQYNRICFNFTSGFPAKYSKWRQGYRISVKGNRVSWYKSDHPSKSYRSYWKYLEQIFTYAGTYSLSKELKKQSVNRLEIGDVFIKGGFPGHAVIVIDMAVNPKNGKRIFLLAQSYMPAQEIQVLKNPNDSSISPWYSTEFGNTLQTPESEFTINQLKRF